MQQSRAPVLRTSQFLSFFPFYRRLDNIDEVKKQANFWMEYRNKNAYVTNWQFTVTDARVKLKRVYPMIKIDKIKKSE